MTPFVPSAWKLNHMLAAAEAKFEASREQSELRREARAIERDVRAQRRAAAGRLYAAIQGVQPTRG